MEIIVSSRSNEIKPGVKKHAEEVAQKIQSIYNKLTSCRVILNVERKEETAEIILHGKNIDIEGIAKAEFVYEAIDKAAVKVEKQLRKHLDKLQAHY